MKAWQTIAAFLIMVCGPVLVHSDQLADKQDDGEIAARRVGPGGARPHQAQGASARTSAARRRAALDFALVASRPTRELRRDSGVIPKESVRAAPVISLCLRGPRM